MKKGCIEAKIQILKKEVYSMCIFQAKCTIIPELYYEPLLVNLKLLILSAYFSMALYVILESE